MSNQSELDEILKKGYRYEGHEYVIDTPYLKQALLDWHNKQTLELLDRLLEHGEDFTTFGDGGRSVAVEYIEAERNRLKEPKV